MINGKAKWCLLMVALVLILLLNLQGKDATMALSNKVSDILQAVFQDDSAGIGLVCCAYFSVLDQCFKELIPVRRFDATDLPFDVLGCCIGWAGTKIREKRRKLRCALRENTAG